MKLLMSDYPAYKGNSPYISVYIETPWFATTLLCIKILWSQMMLVSQPDLFTMTWLHSRSPKGITSPIYGSH